MKSAYSTTAGERLAEGKDVGRYRLHAPVDDESTTAIWFAEDPDLHRRVVLRFVPIEHIRATGKREAVVRRVVTMRRIDHPHVARVFGLEVDGDLWFTVSERISGVSLVRWLEGDRPLRQVAEVFAAVVDGLAAIHRAGLVHGAVRLDDVTVDPGGNARWVAPGWEPPRPGCDAREDRRALCSALSEVLEGLGPKRSPSDRRRAARLTGLLDRGVEGGIRDLRDLAAALRGTSSKVSGVVRGGAGLALVVGLGAAWTGTNRDPTDGCAQVDDPMQRLWSPVVRGEAGQALVDAAPEIDVVHLLRELDDHAAAWTAERAELCHAHRAGALRPPVAFGRRHCLLGRAEDFAAAVELLREDAGHGPRWRAALTDPASCRRREHYADAHPLPANPNRNAQVLVLREDLARARVLLRAGRHAEAAGQLPEILLRARRLAARGVWVHAEALRMAAWGPALRDEPDGAAHLGRLVEAAEEIGDDHVAGRAMAMQLVFLLRYESASPREIERLLSLTASKAARTGDPVTHAMLACVRAGVKDGRLVPHASLECVRG